MNTRNKRTSSLTVFLLIVSILWAPACVITAPVQQITAAIPSETAAPTHTPQPTMTGTPTTQPSPSPTLTLQPRLPEFTHDPQQSIVDSFAPQIQAYLNNAGTVEGLQDALDAFEPDSSDWRQTLSRVSADDLNGNGVQDILVDIQFYESGQYYEEALLVYVENAGQFDSLTIAEIYGQLAAGPHPAVRFIGDMNGNTTPEILYTDTLIVGTHGIFTRGFHIVEWQGDAFGQLINNPDFPDTAFAINSGDGEVVDVNQDGVLELVITHGAQVEPGGDPAPPQVDIWFWEGSVFSLR